MTHGLLPEGHEWRGGSKRPIEPHQSHAASSSNRESEAPNSRLAEGSGTGSGSNSGTSGEASGVGIGYGLTPAVAVDANENVEVAVEALKDGKHPERLSALIAPEAFDAQRWEKDEEYRREYLRVVEPGRVFQTAEPGEDVPRLIVKSPRRQRVVQGEAVELEVASAPGMPVTFTSFDLGRFENQLTTMTVQAGADGIAKVMFWGMPGTINDVNILVASPMASGQERLVVNVQLPDGRSPLDPAGTPGAAAPGGQSSE